MGDDLFVGDKGGDVEYGGADGEVGFGAFFVEFGVVDADGGAAVAAVSYTGGFGWEGGKMVVVGVVEVEDGEGGSVAKKEGFGREIVWVDWLVGLVGDEVGEDGHEDGGGVEGVVGEEAGGGFDDGVAGAV